MSENVTRKLYRSRVDRMIGGVCGGIAEYFSIDVTVVRILWVLAAFFNGMGILIYLIFLVLMPENPEQKAVPKEERARSQNTGLIIGIVLVVFGLSLIFRHPFNLFWNFQWPFRAFWFFSWDFFWPVLLILFGIWYIFYTMQKEEAAGEAKAREPESKVADEKKLTRSKTDKMIGGVCAGLARYWNIDVTLVRVGFVFLAIVTNVVLAIVAYIVALIVIPEQTQQTASVTVAEPEKKPRTRRQTRKKEDESKEQK